MPPRIIPAINPNSIENEGEKAVYEALHAQLPDDWVVRFNYDFVAFGWRLFDGQADFIVLVPGKGLMVIEVKQSFGFVCEDGIWYAIKPNGRRERLDQSPFEQAQANKHNIVEKIICRALRIDKKEFSKNVTYGHMVIFPFLKLDSRL